LVRIRIRIRKKCLRIRKSLGRTFRKITVIL
jgi:hypothetical protein